MQDFTIAIIAGGKSSRMGVNKAFIQLGGKPLIEHVINRTRDLGQAETILVTNTPDEYIHLKLPMYRDAIPDSGSLGGIYTALYHSNTPQTAIIACDMPFINAELLKIMLAKSTDMDAIVPLHNNYPQGFHAVYRQSCLRVIKAQISQKQFKVKTVLDNLTVQYLHEADYHQLDSTGASFFNINAPDDLKQAEKLFRLIMSADTPSNHDQKDADNI